MPTVIAGGQITLLDLNDAFVAGTQPSNPVEGMLWVDTSTTPSRLKIYKLGSWIPQTLSLVDLDPDYGNQKGRIDDLIDDAKLSHTERGDLATYLYELIPVLPATGTALAQAGTSADTAPELFSGATWQAGLIYQTRKAALDVGLLTSNAAFVLIKTKYNALVTQLNLMKTASAPIIYGWETSATYKSIFVPAANGDAFRTALKELYQAINALASLTTKFVNDENIYKDSYGNQLVGNAYGDTGTNRNFSNFTYSSAEKVTGKGSFYRSVTNVVTSDEFIPIDPTRNYVLRIQTKGSTSTGKHVVGLLCYNAAGTNLGERYIVRDSANSYFLSYTTAWTSYRGRIGGLGGGTDVNSSMFPVGTASVKIYFSTNLYTTTNVGYFADIEFDVEKIESGVDYNGINLSGTSGITVESAKNTLTMNATKGIEIIKKTDPSNPVFKLDSNTGDLNVKGNINMTGGTISWANVGSPSAAQVGAATPSDVATAVEGVSVGGRNLLLGTSKTFTSTRVSDSQNKGFSMPTGDFMDTVSNFGNGTILESNQTYIISFDYEFTAGYTSTIGIGLGTGSSPKLYETDLFYAQAKFSEYGQGTKGKFVAILKTTNLGTYKYFMMRPLRDDLVAGTSTIVIKNLKLEKGNKATDWTPAPEDTLMAISNVKTGGRNLIQTPNMSYLSGGQVMDKSNYPINGSLRLYVSAVSDGARFYIPSVQPNTNYVLSYKYRKVSGTLTAFGGHTDSSWTTNTTTVDGMTRGWYSDTNSVFVADDTNIHKVVVKFTTPYAVSGTNLIYIQPNRSNTTPVVVDIFDLQLEEGTNPSDWSLSMEDAAQANKDASQATRNYYVQKSFGGSGCLATYDSIAKEWTLTFNEGTSSWRGLRYNGLNAIINPLETVTISYEVYADVAVDMAVDVNNYKVSTGVAGGNDNDDMSMRKVSPGTTVAGKWTKQVVQYTMGAVPEPYFDNTVICIANNYVAPAGFKIKIRKLQFQKGLVASDWMSASEEVDASVTKLEGMEIGGSNILDNSNFEVTFASGSVTSKHPDLYASGYGGYNGGVVNATTAYHAHIDNTTFSFPVIEYNESDGTRTWKAATAQNIKIDSAGTYMFSFDAYATGPGTKLTGGFYYTKKLGSNPSFYSGQMDVRGMTENGWSRMSVELKLNEDVDLNKSINFYMYGYDFTANSILYIKNLQIEKGNKVTAWSPSAYDTQKRMDALRVAMKATGLVTVIDKDNIQTGKVKADFIDVKGLTVNNGAKDTFKVDMGGNVSIDGNVNMIGGSISWANVGTPSAAQVGAATPDQVSTAVSNVKVGGRNLLSDSGRLVSTTSYGMTTYPLTKTIAAGTQVTVSMKATLGAGKRYFGLYNSGGNVQVATLAAAQLGSDGVYRYTFNWAVGSSSNVNLTVYHMDSTTTATSTIEWIKLEEGNKSTDWTPAPEDITSEVNAFRTAAAASGLVTVIDKNTIQTGKIKANYIDVKGLTVNNGSKDTFKVDSAGNVSVDGSINMTGGTISWGAVGSPSAAQVGAATPGQLQAAVDGVMVGGRNLVLNSTFNDGFRKWNTIATGYTVLAPEADKPFSNIATVSRSGLTSAGYASAYTTKIPATTLDEWYTISFDFKVADFSVFSDMPYVGIYEFYNSAGTRVQYKDMLISDCGYTTLVNNKWYRMSYSVKSTNSTSVSLAFRASLFKNGQVYYREVQIEKGTKATDWTPAVEDMASEILGFKTAAAATGLVTVVDKDTVQTGKVKADYIDVKGLTVNNGATDTFKVDAGGNVSINGTLTANANSNIYSKAEAQLIAKNTNNIGLGMKMNFGTFSAAATNKVYFHGFSYNDTNKTFVPADVDGFFYSYDNTTKVYPTKGVLDVSTGTPLTQGYVIYDTATSKFYFIRYDVPTGNWYRYNAADSAKHNQTFTFTSTMFIIADLDLAS